MTHNPQIDWCTIPTPIGDLTFAWNSDGLLEVDFTDSTDMAQAFVLKKKLGNLKPRPTKGSTHEKALRSYFEGDLNAINDIEIAPVGTEFSRSVWTALCNIPAGTTKTYGEVAAALKNPNASRAVGLACNRNPIAVVVPCHRVVGSSGKLTGYAGGLHLKEWLLEHEGVKTEADQHRLL